MELYELVYAAWKELKKRFLKHKKKEFFIFYFSLSCECMYERNEMKWMCISIPSPLSTPPDAQSLALSIPYSLVPPNSFAVRVFETEKQFHRDK